MGRYGCVLLFFIGVGMKVSKTLIRALVFNKVAVIGYAIYNNLLDCHGWKPVRRLVQDASDGSLIYRIKHRVG
jgi:hypothetical protein